MSSLENNELFTCVHIWCSVASRVQDMLPCNLVHLLDALLCVYKTLSRHVGGGGDRGTSPHPHVKFLESTLM